MALNLFTASYRAFRPEWDATPVQTSNGRPRYPLDYPLDYPLVYQAKLIYPDWSMVRMAMGPEFTTAYRALLGQRGVENIEDTLRSIADRSRTENLVLLCFEKGASACHRGTFAAWWTERTGAPVVELTSDAAALRAGLLS